MLRTVLQVSHQSVNISKNNIISGNIAAVSSIQNIQKRNSAIDKMLKSKRFKGNIHKRLSLDNWLKWKKQTKGMDSEQWRDIVEKNRRNSLPRWTPVTEFDKLYHKYIYHLQFQIKKMFKDTNLIKMLGLVQNIDDLTRVMQLWRVCLRRPVRFTVQFTEALVDKLLEYGELDAAVTLVSGGRYIFLPVSRSVTNKLVTRLAEEQRSDDILKIFESACKGLFTFSPQKADYLFFIQHLKGQEQGLKVFFTYPGDFYIANHFLSNGHETETYRIVIETCKELNATRKAEHVYHEMLYNCNDTVLLEEAKNIVDQLKTEYPVQEVA